MWSCLLVYWARLVKNLWGGKKKRREKQRCTGQLDFSLVSCGILYGSDCVGLYHRTILNYLNPLKVYLIINSCIHDNGPSGEGFSKTCPVYRYSHAVVHEPSLQVFWYRHSLIMFNCLLICIPLSSSCYGLWIVCRGRDAATVIQISPLF